MWQKKQTSSESRAAGKEPPKARDPRTTEPNKDARKFIDNRPAKHNMDPTASQRTSSASNESLPASLPAFSQQVLVYHESKSADTGSDWMYRLKEDSAQFLAEQSGVKLGKVYREAMYKQGIESLMDKVYGLLQRYSFEFNQVAAGTDLHVSSTISGDVTEVTHYNRMREAVETKTYFRARFSTRLYSLVLRGNVDTVDFYLLPTNKVMMLSKLENELRSVATIQVKITDQGMMWRMADGIPPVENLEDLSMWLFTGLIEQTKQLAAEHQQPQ